MSNHSVLLDVAGHITEEQLIESIREVAPVVNVTMICKRTAFCTFADEKAAIKASLFFGKGVFIEGAFHGAASEEQQSQPQPDDDDKPRPKKRPLLDVITDLQNAELTWESLAALTPAVRAALFNLMDVSLGETKE